MIQIINPSALVNGYILNGVAHFTQATNPTVRIGGGALVVGDKLYRTDLNQEATWQGTYWVSPLILSPVTERRFLTAYDRVQNLFTVRNLTYTNILIRKIWSSELTSSNNSGSIFRQISLARSDDAISAPIITFANTSTYTPSTDFSIELNPNHLLNVSSGANVINSATTLNKSFYIEDNAPNAPAPTGTINISIQTGFSFVMP